MMTLASGQVLQNRYQIDMALGRGAAGGVYSGWDATLNIPVAVKEQYGGSTQAAELFVRQARALAGLRHPALPHIIDYFTAGSTTAAGSPFAAVSDQARVECSECSRYLVMEFIEGPSLAEILAESGRALPEERVLPWIDAVCDAVAYLHAQNPPILHRDIKPANIRIAPQRRVALVDYGIQMPAGADDEATLISGQSPADQVGVSPYAAPELLVGQAGAASDQYALGAVLYTLLTGRPPVDALRRRRGQALPLPRQLNPAISPGVEAAILPALALEPERRFAGVADLRQALAAARQASANMYLTPQPVIAPTQLAGAPAYSNPPPYVQPHPGAASVYPAQPRTVLAPVEPGYPGDLPQERGWPPAAAGDTDRKWLIPLAIGLFGLLCLGMGILGGYGVYVFLIHPATATVVGPTGTSPVAAVVTTAAPTAIGVVPSQEPLPSLTPFATNTLPPPSATFPARPTQAGGLETHAPAGTATLRPTWQPCSGAPPSRLYVGDSAYVSFDPPVPNRVRKEPGTGGEVIGFIQPGEKVEIIGGPMCANQWTWWQVRSQSTGMTGWTVEGDRNAYWLVPLDRTQ